jgi:hypothetical protein
MGTASGSHPADRHKRLAGATDRFSRRRDRIAELELARQTAFYLRDLSEPITYLSAFPLPHVPIIEEGIID